MLQKLLSRFLKKKPQPDIGSRTFSISSDAAIPDHPVSFGYKCAWIAVHTSDTNKLVAAFGLTNVITCNWKYGISYAYEDRFFISPPVDGWTFIVSRSLPYAQDERSILILKAMLVDLSTEFGQAQYFGTYRPVGYDSWIKAENGQILRAYAVVDGTNTIVEGEPTAVEKKYNLYNTLSDECHNDPDYFDREDIDYPDETMTMEIAGSWSFNPQDLEERSDLSQGLGLQGFCQWD